MVTGVSFAYKSDCYSLGQTLGLTYNFYEPFELLSGAAM